MKPMIMTHAYDGKFSTTMKHVGTFLDELDPHGFEFPFGEEPTRAKMWMAKTVIEVLQQGPQAEAVRQWLRQAGRLVAQFGKPLAWRTPSGWPWAMAYARMRSQIAAPQFERRCEPSS